MTKSFIRSGAVPLALRKEVADIFLSRYWVRALLETENDKLGLILRAAYAKPTVNPPWLGPTAIVTPEGVVLSNYVDEHNRMHSPAVVCELVELVDNARALCERLSFSQAEAEGLFLALRQWITIDARPETEQPEDRIPIEYRRHEA